MDKDWKGGCKTVDKSAKTVDKVKCINYQPVANGLRSKLVLLRLQRVFRASSSAAVTACKLGFSTLVFSEDCSSGFRAVDMCFIDPLKLGFNAMPLHFLCRCESLVEEPVVFEGNFMFRGMAMTTTKN